MSKEPEQKWTAQKLLELIKVKYPGPAWACFGEVRNATGFSRQVRTADAVAMSLYPSRGLELYGFEIKVSRSDWRKELEDPSKADEIARFCHRWYIVAPPGVVPRSELPPAWGLLEPSGGGPLRVKSRAELLEAQPPTLSFVASLVRKAGEWTDDRLEGMVPAGSIEEQVQKRLVAEKLRMRTEFGRAPGDLARLRDRVRAFEQASGVPFGEVWQTPQEMGKLYQIAHLIHDLERGRAFLDHCKAQLEGSAQRIGEMRKELSRMVSLDDQAHPGDAVHAPASASLDTSGSSASVRTLRDDLVAGRIRHESGRWFDVAEEDDADHEGAWRPIRAHDAEEAAERYAEEVEDGCDWPGEDGNTMDLVVRDIVSKREKRFTVAASLEWSYSARERSSQSGEGSRSGSSEVSGAPPQDPKRGPR